MKKIVIVVVFIMSLISGLNASGATFLVNQDNLKLLKAPHVYEFSSLNPDDNWWCGHAAFSSALSLIGVNKNINEIHEDFLIANQGLGVYVENDAQCNGADYCASPVLIIKTSKKYNVRPLRSNISDKNTFWNKIKSSTAAKKPTIVLSDDLYDYSLNRWRGIGHYFTVIGYYIKNNNTKYVIVRDPYKISGGKYYDNIFTLDTFWSHIKGSSYVPTVTIIK